MSTTKTIRIDTDTLNESADLVALRSAIAAEFPGVDVEIKSTGRGTEVEGFADNEAARDSLRVVVERADF